MIPKVSTALLLLGLLFSVSSLTTVSSFQELAQLHCRIHPIETFYRLASGQLAEVYGPEYADLDCYIRQFVNKGTLPAS